MAPNSVVDAPVNAVRALSLNTPCQNVLAATTQKSVAMAPATPPAATFAEIGLPGVAATTSGIHASFSKPVNADDYRSTCSARYAQAIRAQAHVRRTAAI